MKDDPLTRCFSQDQLDAIFPREKADAFFDALLGDAAEGAYDIRLTYQGRLQNQLRFFFELHQRPGKCLACNLTYGLPRVFARHPVIDVDRIVNRLVGLLGDPGACGEWELAATKEISRQVHAVPLMIQYIKKNN